MEDNGIKLKKYLSWIGENDFKFIESNRGYDNGSIFAFLNSNFSDNIDQFHLLHTIGYKDEEFKQYIKKISQYFNRNIVVHDVKLENPTDYAKIYQIVIDILDETSYYHIQMSSGTSQMAATWLLIHKTTLNKRSTLYQGYFNKVLSKDTLFKVEIPFDIELDFLPTLNLDLERKEDKLFKDWNKIPEYLKIKHKSETMKNLLNLVYKVSKLDIPTIILGETGVGKELIAKAIHSSSDRFKNRMITVNCASLNSETAEATLFGWSKGAWTNSFGEGRGVFLDADKSTIFLDEIGDLSLDIQAKLLRVIEYGVINRVGDGKEIKVDVRVLTATNRDLIDMVRKKLFRRDLFYRLNVAIIKVPPLRERKEDIYLISKYFLNLQNEKLKKIKDLNYIEKAFSVQAITFLQEHSWPGNIRELYHTIERATIWTETDLITEAILKKNIITVDYKVKENKNIVFPIDIARKLRSIEKEYIIAALKKTNYNILKTTEILGYANYQTLNNKMKKYRIHI